MGKQSNLRAYRRQLRQRPEVLPHDALGMTGRNRRRSIALASRENTAARRLGDGLELGRPITIERR